MSGDEFARRFEVVAETRRRWSREEKLAIVEEASGPCVNISAVARRQSISHRIRAEGTGTMPAWRAAVTDPDSIIRS